MSVLQEAISYKNISSETIRLVQVTDPHIFNDKNSQLLGVNTTASLQSVVDNIIAADFSADLLLATGDISQDFSAESYRTFVNQVARLNLPCHYLPGNHDDPRLMYLHMQGERVYGQKRILIGNWQILMLDSTLRTKPGGHLAKEEFKLIDSALAECPNHHTLIAMHHNPIKAHCTWLDQHCLENGDVFLEYIGQYAQVRGVLWGHIHQELDSEYRHAGQRIKLMATPSTCIQFKPKSAIFALDSLQPGYRLLELKTDGSIDTCVYRVSGDVFTPELNSNGY